MKRQDIQFELSGFGHTHKFFVHVDSAIFVNVNVLGT